MSSINETFKQTFIQKVRSGSQLLWVMINGDEGAALRAMYKLATGRYDPSNKDEEQDPNNLKCGVQNWDINSGASWNDKLSDPLVAIMSLSNTPMEVLPSSLIVMRDLHLLLAAPQNVQLRRALVNACSTNALCNTVHNEKTGTNELCRRQIVILSNGVLPPSDLRAFADIVDFPLPDAKQIEDDVFDFIQMSLRMTGTTGAAKSACTAELKEQVISALLGLSAEEAQRILSYAVTRCDGFNDGLLAVIADEKAMAFRKMEGMTFVPHSKIMAEHEIGGYGVFIDFLKKRLWTYGRHAQQLGVERPRGAAVIGVPGSGKTSIAKAAARILKLDLVVLDIGSMYDKYVGGSESKMRTALAMLSAMPNVLVLVD